MSKNEKDDFELQHESGATLKIDTDGVIQFFEAKKQEILDDYGMYIRHPVKFKRVSEHAIIPKKQKKFDACWDLYAAEAVTFPPMHIFAVDTGLQMEMPNYLMASIRPRSGLAFKKGITVLNAPGTIDSGYRGNIKVILINLSRDYQYVSSGDRIAQMQFELTQHVEFEEVDDLNDSERGTGGFGSTGD